MNIGGGGGGGETSRLLFIFSQCSPFKALDKKLIGGVTLNHLSWAALGGGKLIGGVTQNHLSWAALGGGKLIGGVTLNHLSWAALGGGKLIGGVTLNHLSWAALGGGKLIGGVTLNHLSWAALGSCETLIKNFLHVANLLPWGKESGQAPYRASCSGTPRFLGVNAIVKLLCACLFC